MFREFAEALVRAACSKYGGAPLTGGPAHGGAATGGALSAHAGSPPPGGVNSVPEDGPLVTPRGGGLNAIKALAGPRKGDGLTPAMCLQRLLSEDVFPRTAQRLEAAKAGHAEGGGGEEGGEPEALRAARQALAATQEGCSPAVDALFAHCRSDEDGAGVARVSALLRLLRDSGLVPRELPTAHAHHELACALLGEEARRRTISYQ